MSSASSSNTPCAACKVQRRKCTQDCVFAPYFPPDQPQKFCNVHKVFGASNVSKLLQELNASQREDAVNSLAYEAEARLRDPVYGCVGLISLLQHRLREVQSDLIKAKKELANYVGSQPTMIPILQPPPVSYNGPPTHHPHQQQFLSIGTNNNPSPMIGIPKGAASSYAGAQEHIVINVDPHHQQQQQQQFLETQQLAAVLAAREQQELLRMTMEHKLHQPQEFVRVVNSNNSGFDPAGASTGGGSSSHGFNPNMAGGGSSSNISPVLALGSFDNSDNYHVNQPQQPDHHQHHHQQLPHQHLLREQLLLGQTPQPVQTQEQLLLHQHQTQMLRKLDGEKGKSAGPSC